MKSSSAARKRKTDSPPVVLTVGHSTHPFEEFVALLRAHGVTCVADVRTVPRSLHNPQFNKASLSRTLPRAGLGYVHLPGLGGLRRARPDSVNTGWRNASFRGYADYMQTPEFGRSLDELMELAGDARVALMCAEALPWRCHRSLIADALLVRGIAAEDIMTPTRRAPHTLTPFARVRGTRLTYPSGAAAEPPAATKRATPRAARKRARQGRVGTSAAAAPASRARAHRASAGGR